MLRSDPSGEVAKMRANGKAMHGAGIVGLGAALGLAIAGGCGPSQPATGPGASSTGTEKPFDQCDKSPPLATKYTGLLRDARCDYDRYPIMAGIAKSIGADCSHCHAPDPNNPKEELYAQPTPKKEIANWMRTHLMSAIKPADGSELTCKSCHVDEKGKPVVKILGEPRDRERAQDWMSDVMTVKFVVAKTGERLKCKHCHLGSPRTPEWQDKVILTDHIPPH